MLPPTYPRPTPDLSALRGRFPQEKAYAFDEDYVRNELMYYDVPESDQHFVVLALARIGLIPYVTPDGRTRLFKIGIHDGMFSTKIVRDTSE